LFCPVCRLEYRPGFTHCSDCDVDLVAALPQKSAAAQAGMRDLRSPTVLRQGVSAADAPLIRDALNAAGIPFNERRALAELVADGSPTEEFWVNAEDRPRAQSVMAAAMQGSHQAESVDSLNLLWGGSDRGFFDRLCAALEGQGIDCFKYEPVAAHLSEGFPRNPLEVSVRAGDFHAASDIFEAIKNDWNPGDSADAAAPESISVNDLAADSASDEDIDDLPPDDELDDELTAEAWSGRSTDQAELLKLCLREVGVSSRVAKAQAGVRVLVAPKSINRAREVIREVIESTPSD